MTQLSLRTVEVSGGPHERGYQYGAATADLIDKAITFYEAAFAEQAGLCWCEVKDLAVQWLPLCEEVAPELMAELRGVAEGAGRDILDLMILNVRGEIIYDRGFGRARPAEQPDGCTSFSLAYGAAGDGGVYAGQNWDWRTGVQDTVVALRVVQDPLPTLIMQVEAGQIGRHGVNSAGIALNANGLGGRFDAELGVPQTFIRRMVLNQSELSDALNVAVRTRSHIASNALITHRSGFSIDLEITPHGVEWLYPTDGLLVHGNHYQGFVPAALSGRYRPIAVDSLIRVPQATRNLAHARYAANRDDVRALIRAAMSDHLGYPESLCTHPDERRPEVRQWSTLLSSCVDLSAGEYYVTNGTPCDHEYERLPWNVFDGPGSRYAEVTAAAVAG